jgi:hypothetical protein
VPASAAAGIRHHRPGTTPVSARLNGSTSSPHTAEAAKAHTPNS